MHLAGGMASRLLKEAKAHEWSKFEFMALCHRKDDELRPGALRVMVPRHSKARIK
jgi:hypothetical protein